MRTRSYSELSQLETFEDRFEYLKLGGNVGRSTFGFDRYINQQFYQSREWSDVRGYIMVRDNGCDLGVFGYEIPDRALIHHMNPVDVEDLMHNAQIALDPEYLITTTHKTHNAIHYGSEIPRPMTVVERQPNDTTLW